MRGIDTPQKNIKLITMMASLLTNDKTFPAVAQGRADFTH
jgi:hypothetical protein